MLGTAVLFGTDDIHPKVKVLLGNIPNLITPNHWLVTQRMNMR